MLGGVYSMGFDNCIKKMLKIHHCSFIQNSFIALKKILCPLLIYSFPLPTLATTDLFTVSIVLPFPECHTVGIISYVAFSDWLLPLSNMCLEFLDFFYDLIIYFFLILNSSLLSGFNTIYLSTHLLKNILVVYQF